ncbi:hypothetical protein M099_3417 [Phocaeicola vulgatus str. 3975 RP4]|uniref:Uncharacterized protein n=1 Tax=Phocaeicola vulgatus str. 3975 RP4 TaxID=1339352 RepID=A0A069S966_PHOVU|nr:hypothetical protein M099_3417 [Phocaeicola vulgatus str. 3975 RP4]
MYWEKGERDDMCWVSSRFFSFYLIPVKFTLTPSNVPFKKFPANHTFSKYEMSLGP